MNINQSVVVPMYMMNSGQAAVKTFLGELKNIGFSAVEFWGRDEGVPFEKTVEDALSLGFRIASMGGHGHKSEKDGSHAEGFSRAKNHERLEAELRESIDIAVKYDIPGLITLSGHRNHDESDYRSMLVCAEGLRRIAPYAEEKGINLNMEILNTTVNHPNYLCDNVDWAIGLCELVNSPRVKILFDIYHVQIMQGNIIHNIKSAAKWVGHYHTAGNPGRNNLDETQELHYPGIMRAIGGSGYELYVGHEFIPKGDSLDALAQAYWVCDVGN
ncbi:MAG: TIM barrel protein [Spirochaetales bacterium]|nr:TIM barrel protein [Spirochaetales bacterium]